ncbi:MAG: excinuclease ABC subunit A [Gammaproteobacteria bacterium]|nr:MAG: excinuclease ABC subunit A [Gammaproteobacteria bacterium]
MTKSLLAAITALMLVLSANAFARDDHNLYSIAEAMNTENAKAVLNRGYTFKFAGQPHRKVVKRFGEFMSNKKTRAVGRTDKEACQHAFLSAMLSFQDRIAKEGGNAVINLHSYYRKENFKSSTQFMCGNGAIMAGVTFKGDVVTLAK